MVLEGDEELDLLNSDAGLFVTEAYIRCKTVSIYYYAYEENAEI